MNEQPESELMEATPIGLSAFIRVRDTDGGDVLINVREITAVLGILGRAKAAFPEGAEARLLLRGGTNIPVTATIDQITALLGQVAIVASGEGVDETVTALPPRLYTPDDAR